MTGAATQSVLLTRAKLLRSSAAKGLSCRAARCTAHHSIAPRITPLHRASHHCTAQLCRPLHRCRYPCHCHCNCSCASYHPATQVTSDPPTAVRVTAHGYRGDTPQHTPVQVASDYHSARNVLFSTSRRDQIAPPRSQISSLRSHLASRTSRLTSPALSPHLASPLTPSHPTIHFISPLLASLPPPSPHEQPMAAGEVREAAEPGRLQARPRLRHPVQLQPALRRCRRMCTRSAQAALSLLRTSPA